MGKGDGFERDVSRMLSLWWTGDERDDVFWRTSASGATATSRRKGKNKQKTKYMFGDITFVNPIGKPLIDRVLIEAKRGYTNTSKPLLQKDLLKTIEAIKKYKVDTDISSKQIRKLFSKTKKSGGVSVLNFIDGVKEREEKLLEWWRKAEEERIAAGRDISMVIFRRDSKTECVCMDDDILARCACKKYITLRIEGYKLYIFPLSCLFVYDPKLFCKVLDVKHRKIKRFKLDKIFDSKEL